MRSIELVAAAVILAVAGEWRGAQAAAGAGATGPAAGGGVHAAVAARRNAPEPTPGCSARSTAKATVLRAEGAAATPVCAACAERANWAAELQRLGAGTHVVPLKNGVMYVYTAEAPERVRALQAALVQRHERMHTLETSGDGVRLCPECRAMRGAAVSGKLEHESVNIEGGCMFLMTSSDNSIVSRIYALAGMAHPSRGRS